MMINIKQSLRYLFVGICAFTYAFASAEKSKAESPNILFIGIDDLRPTLGAYGDSIAKTPHLDALAGQGITFKRAFASVPTCGASRASLLTGIRPTASRFVYARTKIEEDAPSATTLPKHFKEHGYYTVSLGKITDNKNDIASHWSEEPWRPQHPKNSRAGNNQNYYSPENKKIAALNGGKAGPYENYNYDEELHLDAITARKAIAHIKMMGKRKQPFFLAVGFSKPHLPFSVPSKYWDLYSKEKIGMPDNYFKPKNAPRISYHTSGELRTYYGTPKKMPVSDEMALNLRHGYYAAASFADAQVGKVLQALKDSEMEKDTIVVVWGDHGWNLGEHLLWNKHSNFYTSINAPLLIKVPGKKAGIKTDALTEFVDIFPTLCDLAGLPKPEQLQGESLVALLDNPDDHKDTVAFSQWKDGTTMFTERYAFTQWYNKKGEVTDRMLYDHKQDPDENMNIAPLEKNKALIEKLAAQMDAKRSAIK